MYTKEGSIKDLREVLRVKIKSLAEEAKIIRAEENKCKARSNPAKAAYMRLRRLFRNSNMSKEELKEAILAAKQVRAARRVSHPTIADPIREQMYVHRVGVVRRESRNAHLAYCIIRGKSIEKIDSGIYPGPNWKEVQRLVEKYGDPRIRIMRADGKTLIAYPEAAEKK